ncbi:hypothetical protein ABRY23_12865 [Melioribacteraceae bacterium 4301-Me]|uniref:hypothetical protein n=1 Tax=Pyranulibacter aquaticus TaxID=3163344 RepID=UPI00359B8AC0
MVKAHLVILLFICALVSCNQNDISIIRYHPNKSELVLTDSIIFSNTDDLYIGSINDIEVISGNIYISDKSFSKIHVLDNKLNYLFSIGKYGDGPGEFATAPYLSDYDSNLVVFDRKYLKLMIYSKNILLKEIYLPKNFFYQTHNPLFLKGKIIIPATNKLSRELKNLRGYTTILLLNKNGTFFSKAGELVDDYTEHEEELFYARHPFSIISAGPGDSFYAIQEATFKYQRYNMEGNLLETFEYKPRFFKNPPSVKVNQEAKDLKKAYENYYTKISYYAKLLFDKKNQILFVNYRSLNMNHYYSRSFLDADNFLIAIDSKGQCILDQKIDGYLADIDDGFIYVLVEESPQRFVINKYILKVYNNE